MQTIRARNVHQALPEAARLLTLYGKERETRTGTTVQFTEPLSTEFLNPNERVLFWPQRDANPFFHLFESLWMLAGRKDVAYLQRFNKRMVEFSDDGATFNGAYGHRWRAHFGRDQLVTIATALWRDPTCRRQVLNMWDVRRDLGLDSKDLPCLAGGTVLWSPEGDLPLDVLARRFESGELTRWPVYSVDEHTKEVRLAWVGRVWRSGRKRAIRVRFDDGSHLTLTPDHTLYRRERRAQDAWPVQAGSLRPGMRVLATSRFVGPKGHEQFKRRLGHNTNFGNMVPTHREYARLLWGTLPAGMVVHHRNHDASDNRAANLAVITKSEHDSLHRRGDLNPMRRLTPAQHALRANKQAASLRANWARLTPEERSLRSCGLLDNHRVVAVEDAGEIAVYDFTVVSGPPNALVGTGVVAHNCNTQAYFQVGADERLNLMVTNRSNDLIWGAHGANAVHFSVLLEYMAARVQRPVGTYHQVSMNTHYYKERHQKLVHELADVATDPPSRPTCPYTAGVVSVCPLINTSLKVWEKDLYLFVSSGANFTFEDQFFEYVAKPLAKAHSRLSADTPNRYDDALGELSTCVASDWRMAAEEWIVRRRERSEGATEPSNTTRVSV